MTEAFFFIGNEIDILKKKGTNNTSYTKEMIEFLLPAASNIENACLTHDRFTSARVIEK